MSIFTDLKKSIRDVLENAKYSGVDILDIHTVKTEKLKNLQAEYNICFIEPDDKQLEVIE